MLRILHAGCGTARLPAWFPFDGEEIRLDADAAVKPDIVASIDNLGEIGTFDLIYCGHCLEHLHWQDAATALREFHRVLRRGGGAFVQVPNLRDVKPDNEVLYVTDDGLPVSGLDMIYGCREFSAGNPLMMHRCGFVPHTLKQAMADAGFVDVEIVASDLELLGVGRTQPPTGE